MAIFVESLAKTPTASVSTLILGILFPVRVIWNLKQNMPENHVHYSLVQQHAD
jgi:hypothetical protein